MDGDDFLRECMGEVPPIPVDEFNRRFCLQCPHRACVRSAARQSAFDRRVRTWKDVLFDRVSRADDADPAFEHIRSKRFLSSGGTQATVQEPLTASSPSRFSSREIVIVGQDPDASPILTPEIVPAPANIARVPPTVAPLQDNTDFEQGSYVGDSPEPGTKDVVVAPGGSFTFGGSDE